MSHIDIGYTSFVSFSEEFAMFVIAAIYYWESQLQLLSLLLVARVTELHPKSILILRHICFIFFLSCRPQKKWCNFR